MDVLIPEIPAVDTGMAFKDVSGDTACFKGVFQFEIILPEIVFSSAYLDETGDFRGRGELFQQFKEVIPIGCQLLRRTENILEVPSGIAGITEFCGDVGH